VACPWAKGAKGFRGAELRQFSVELEALHEKVLQMGGYVESAIHRSVRALVDRDAELARQVLRDEARINQMEMEIDNLTTRLFALRQPMAKDLRFLTAAMKINTDLERMGDLAVNIAQRALSLVAQPQVKPLIDIPRIAVGRIHAAAGAGCIREGRCRPRAQRIAGGR